MFATFKNFNGDDVVVVISKVTVVDTHVANTKEEPKSIICMDNSNEYEVRGSVRATRNAIIRAGQPQPADASETEASDVAE